MKQQYKLLLKFFFRNILSITADICIILFGLNIMFSPTPTEREEAKASKAKKEMAEEAAKSEPPAENKSATTAFEKYIARHEPHALNVKTGKTFWIHKELKPLQIDGESVQFGGTSDQEVLLNYAPHHPARGHSGINGDVGPALRQRLKSIPGGPATRIAGDMKVGDYTVHVLDANNEECRYAITNNKKGAFHSTGPHLHYEIRDDPGKRMLLKKK